MNGQRRVYYDVQEAPGFEDKAILAFGSFGRWELIKEYIEQYIAREPTIGYQVPGTRFRALSIDNPVATIYYTIDNERIDASGSLTGVITLWDVEPV